MRSLIVACITFLTAVGCTSTKYAKEQYALAAKSYDSSAKVVISLLKQDPAIVTMTADSLKLPAQNIVSPNFGIRKPNMVIIHHTAQNSCTQTLDLFTGRKVESSSHYVICRDGTLYHMINDYYRSWHAGVSKWGNITDINSVSIGIELDNNGFEPFPAAQINTLLGLLENLKKSYGIPTQNFIGHGDIAPGRKVDPSKYFPWKTLADKGFGKWYGDTSNIELPKNFDETLALRLIGYDIKNIAAATESFRRHFTGSDKKGALDEGERKILFVLLKEFM